MRKVHTTKQYQERMIRMVKAIALVGIVAGLMFAMPIANVLAAEGGEAAHAADVSHGPDVTFLLWIAVILLAGKIGGSLAEKLGQPEVLGQLIMGIALGALPLLNISWFEPITHDPFVIGSAVFGVVLLLFGAGLESNIDDMRRVGGRAMGVAIVGVFVPFALGAFVAGPLVLPGLSSIEYYFLGAALTATSVGITAAVYQSLGKMKLDSSKMVLGAAVIDDILGLVILAVVSALATEGVVSLGLIGGILGKAVFFLVAAIVIGYYGAPQFGKFFAILINNTSGGKFITAIVFAFTLAYLAQIHFGLAAIVGAFAAGLVLDRTHFKFFRDPEVAEEIREEAKKHGSEVERGFDGLLERLSERHVEDLIKYIKELFVPVFFVTTGMSVQLGTLGNTSVIFGALLITLVAIIGKVVAGVFAKQGDRLIVGIGMVPRGEVGLIFATIGASLGVVSDNMFSVIIGMIILTTILAPLVLGWLFKRKEREGLQTLEEVKAS